MKTSQLSLLYPVNQWLIMFRPFLKSTTMLFLSTVLFCQISQAQQPSNAHRWTDGDGWTYNLSSGTWVPTVYPANNDLPKGIVRCASSAETENGIQAYKGTYDGVFAIDTHTSCFDPDNESNDIPSVAGPTTNATDIVWFNFDVRAFAGSHQFQIVTNAGRIGWALYYVNAANTEPVNGTNTSTGRFPEDPIGLTGVLGANYANLVYQDCGVDGNGGWATITVPSFAKPTNYYIAMWPLDGDHFESSANLIYKSRFGCGETPVTCSFEKSGDPSLECNSDGTYTVCQDFVGANGKWTLKDNATTPAISYDVKTYTLGGVLKDHFTGTDASAISFILTNLGADGAIKATICATYAKGNDYSIELLPSGMPNPPSNYTGCTAGGSFNGTGLQAIDVPQYSVAQPDCSSTTGSVKITNYQSGITYTLSGTSHTYTSADASFDNGTFNDVAPDTYILTASVTGSCSEKGDNSITINDAPVTFDPPVPSVTQPTCTTATGSVQITNLVDGATYTLSNADHTYTADATGLFGAVEPGTYSLNATKGSCGSKDENDVVINSQPATPDTPSVTAVNNCDGTSTLTVTGLVDGATLNWSDDPDNHSSSRTVTVADTYKVTQTLGECTSGEGSADANPKTKPGKPTVTVIDNCDGTSTLTASNYAGSLLWSPGGSTNSSITVSTAGDYFVTQTVNGCTSDASKGTAAPRTTPSAPSVSGTTTCAPTQASVTATGCIGTLKWYNDATNTTPIATGVSSISTGTTKTYYVSCTNASGCESPRNSATATVNICSGIYPTQTSCAGFNSGTIQFLPKICVTTKKSKTGTAITNATPGVFFYYTKITAPSAIFDVYIDQTQCTGLTPFAANSAQIIAWSNSCVKLATGKLGTNGDVTIHITKAIVGQPIVISVQYSTKSVIGSSVAANFTSCQADFVVRKGTTAAADIWTPDNTDAKISIVANCSASALTALSSTSASASIAKTGVDISNSLQVKTYPNPFRGIVNFNVVSPVSGKAVIEVYDLLGKKLAIVYQGNIDAGIARSIQYNVPAGNRVPLMYIITVGDKSTKGMILPEK
jgi:hypothetical protein